MSRLSSLLVRDGLVGVKRMEKAFQRQVIYGGSLDTILLEIGAVPEERLTQYLALATGLPPAARDESRLIDPNAVALLSVDAADQFRAVPLSIVADDALRVLVCAPLELTALEDLADLLDRPLQPLITPEYRWHLAFAAAYGTEPPARFATLSRALEIEAPNAPVGRPPTIIVESQPPHDTAPLPMNQRKPALPAPPVVTRKVTPPMPTMAERPPAIRATPVAPVTPVVAPVPDDAPTQPIGAVERGRVDTLLGITAPVVDFTEPEVTPPAAPAPAPIAEDAGRAARIAIDGRDSPLAIVRARDMLATARDRDSVFLTLLRATRARARYAGLMTVQGGAAIGRIALAEPGLDTAGIASVLIPLDIVSPFRSVALNQQPHIGSLASYDAGITAMMSRFGGTVPPSALLMPILLRDRCVAIVIAHRGHGELKLVDVAELLPLAAAAADALGRLIVVKKRNTPASGVPAIKVAAPPVNGRDTEQMPVPPPAADDAPELTFATEPPRPIDEVLDEIEREREGVAELAIADALDRPQEAIGALMRRFPGVLRVERFAVTGRPLRAAQYGGLLELVVRLGPAATELLLAQLSSAQRDARFYATVCAIELRPPGALVALVEKVFDLDYGVRGAAIEALAGYPPSELAQALARARRAVHASDHEVASAAMTALVALGDVDAVDDLVAALERGDRSSDLARRALVALTAQDFGSSERKWRKWWDGAKQKHRIEWLIDGLTHKDDAIRESAIGDLRRLTGEYFGYHHDLPRKDRDDAAERWAAWWRETGYRRFVIREDERLRPTAILPSRPLD